MKKISCLILLLLLSVSIVGCDRNPNSVYFTNNSLKNSNKNVFCIKYEKEDIYKEKYCDMQFLSKSDNVSFVIYEENSDIKYTIEITDKNLWYSFQTLVVNSVGEPNTENFEKYETLPSKTYIIESDTDFTLYIRGVVGDLEKNSDKTGFLLTNKIVVSDAFMINIKKKSTN